MYPDPVFFYHAWLRGDWHPATRDTYFTAADAALPGEWYAGFTGVEGPDELYAATSYLQNVAPYRVDVIAAELYGYEQVTLACLQNSCKNIDPETPVLYTHAKGSFSQHAGNDRWRRQMTDELITAWRQCTDKLNDGYDVVTSWWAKPGDHWHGGHSTITAPYGIAVGNFWWARAGYIATLPSVDDASRYNAENWLGQREPNAFVIHPGDWPDTRLKKVTW